MAEDSGQSVLPALIDRILPLVPGLIEDLERGIDVLDVGCGRGRAMNLLARTFPRSRFLGIDLSADAVAFAGAEASRNGSANVRFEQGDMTVFDVRDAFDLVTAFDAIHDQKAPDVVLAAIARALRPDGVFLMQDIAGSSHVHQNLDHLLGPLLYTVSCMHCMTVSLAGGGAGLGAMWGEEKAGEYLRRAGFNRVEKHTLPHDIQNDYYIARVV
jgi:SAM-dependent methyltransferase